MTSLNVLVTAASRRVPLVDGLRRAVRDSVGKGRVVVTDVNPLSPAVHFADEAYAVPLASDPGYVDALLDVCAAERIGLLVPTIDDELPVIAAARPLFESRGVRVAVSPLRTAELCNDKLETCTYLRAHGVSAAATYAPSALPEPAAMPLFVKPRVGRGGVGAFPVRNARELAFFLEYVTDPVVQQFLPGREFTIDLFCDFEGRPIAAVPRERVVIRAGVIDRGRTVADPRLIDLAVQTARVLPFRGAVNIQCRLVGDEPVIFEINPRFSGGIPLTVAAGANFFRMLVDAAVGRPLTPVLGEFVDDLWMTSYESSLFLDEDTNARALRPTPAGAARVRLGDVA